MSDAFKPGDKVITSIQKFRGLIGVIQGRSYYWDNSYYRIKFNDDQIESIERCYVFKAPEEKQTAGLADQDQNRSEKKKRINKADK